MIQTYYSIIIYNFKKDEDEPEKSTNQEQRLKEILIKAMNKKPKENAENENPENPDDSPKSRQKRQVIENLIETSLQSGTGSAKRTDSRVISDAASEVPESVEKNPSNRTSPQPEMAIESSESDNTINFVNNESGARSLDISADLSMNPQVVLTRLKDTTKTRKRNHQNISSDQENVENTGQKDADNHG